MEALKNVNLAIKQIDGVVLVSGSSGVILIFIGGLLLNINSPNFQIGYPTTAIGFALFVFASNRNNSIKSAKKIDQILEKLDAMQQELEKRNEP